VQKDMNGTGPEIKTTVAVAWVAVLALIMTGGIAGAGMHMGLDLMLFFSVTPHCSAFMSNSLPLFNNFQPLTCTEKP
jgi:hypothetical protein